MAETPDLQNPDTHLLHELQSLHQSLHSSDPSRHRTASLSLPRSTPQTPDPRSRRMSLSPWRPRPKFQDSEDDLGKTPDEKLYTVSASTAPEKKGIWNWKPIRVLTHLGMQRFSCLFSVEVESVRNLPASMNGLRLSVCVRKKETKGGAVSTMPARVLHGAADFEETLFLRCHVYCSASKQRLRFEPRPFLIYVVAVDAAAELDFGRSSADLSRLVQESMEKNSEGTRIRQWDTNFPLSGKAKGGELVLKVGFQIMEDKGVGGIFSAKPMKGIDSSASDSKPFARKQSKSSFSIPSPKISKRFDFDTSTATKELEGIDYLNLDETRYVQKSDPNAKMKMEDLDLPEFEIVEKGIEIQDRGRTGEADSEVSSEIVKEIVHDPIHLRRISELDSIAKQIKALQSMISNEDHKEDADFHVLDAEEETVTKEFLQMLEVEEEEDEDCKPDIAGVSSLKLNGEEAEGVESKSFLSDLAKGLGPVIQTRDGGYLAAINPFQIEVLRRETPKLAMQISKPLILPSQKSASGFEFFQKLAAIGVEELASEVLSAASMDELIGKTAEQMAFEGIAAAIIHGRNKEGASSSVSRSIAVVKSMATAMNAGRKERISTGIWSVSEETVRVEEVLALSLHKIEVMAIEGLKIQAEMGEEEAPFDVSPLMVDGEDPDHLLASAVSLDEWLKNGGFDAEERAVTLVVVLQLRDPLRSFEAVGGPLIAVIQANAVANGEGEGEEEVRFKVGSLHVGGLKVKDGGLRRETWHEEKQRLAAMQWLVANGFGKGAKKGKNVQMKGQDCFWSISSSVMADMWLKPSRNPDVKFPKQMKFGA